MAGESNSDETDVKPAVLPPPTDVDQVEDVKVSLDLMHSSSSPSSEATASTGDLLQRKFAFWDFVACMKTAAIAE